MKHSVKITMILMGMFIITQLIGLFVISIYMHPQNELPYGMEPPEEMVQETSIISILFAFAIAITLFFVLTKINAEKFIRFWFFVVTAIAIGLTLKAFTFLAIKDIIITNPIPLLSYFIPKFSLISLAIFFIIALPLAYYKIFKREIIVHNITELLIYPGIAAVFAMILGVLGVIILLLAISIYDIWAVWHSEFMKNMAKYQINKLKFFTGFFLPYAGKMQKAKIRLIKEKYAEKGNKILEQQFKKAKIKVNLAILGGGDVIFPIITAGVFLKNFGIFPALMIVLSSSIALLYLFIAAKKSRFYPAMPFLTIGMYIGMILSWLIF